MYCMHGLRYLDGLLYALTSALQRLTAACVVVVVVEMSII